MTATHYTLTLELDHAADEATTDWIVEQLADWHAVAARHDSGNALALITLPAESLPQAVATACRLIEPTYRVVSIEATDEHTRDQREGWAPLPDLISVTEAAQRLGISRAAAHKRIVAGTLPARQVGNGWVVPASAVPETAS